MRFLKKKNNRYNKASSKIAERNKIRRNISLFFKILTLTLILVLPILLLRANFLEVQDIEISGVEKAGEESIKKISLDFISGNYFYLIPKSNILFLNEEKLANILLTNFPRLKEVRVDKKVNKNIEIKVKERGGDFLWCRSEEECFNMSSDGLVFEKAEEKTENKKEKIVFKGAIEGDPIRKNFATPETMQNYLGAIEILKNNKIEIFSISLELSDKAVFETSMGDIFLNPEEDMILNAQNVVLLINEIRLKNPLISFQYIDARFGNKIFYK